MAGAPGTEQTEEGHARGNWTFLNGRARFSIPAVVSAYSQAANRELERGTRTQQP